MNCLVACEESQAVTIELRKLGHTAFSCDIQDCSGGYPEYHYKGDCLDIIDGCVSFKTCDGFTHKISDSFDLVICHPPCTYLSNAGIRHFNVDKYGDKALMRRQLRDLAFDFAMRLYNCNCAHVALENPVGYLNSHFRKPDQIIHPYFFGDYFCKRTCLWLRGLPLLLPDYQVIPTDVFGIQPDGKITRFTEYVHDSRCRSRTFPGIARAMAYQFTNNFFVA
jgi:site-specific DNA-cytosine methylase